VKAILYDFRDQGRGWTLRLLDEGGRMVMQSHLLADVGWAIANRIVESCSAPMEIIGPPETILGDGETKDQQIETTVAEVKAASPQVQSGDESPHSKAAPPQVQRSLFA
jgi:hypothetical protein